MGAIIKATFDSIETRFTELVDKKTFAREISFVLQHVQKNPFLEKCEPNSVLQAVMNIAQVGLTLNPILAEAYLIPRYAGKDQQGNAVYNCVLEPSYVGLCKLLTDTGSVKHIYSHVVREGDDFDVELGSDTKVTHKPKFKKDAKITHAYAIGEMDNGKKMIEYMTIEELHFIRGKSESFKAYEAKKIKSCVWVDWESEMCRKAVIKRLCKYLPKTDKWEKVAEAISLDNNDFQLDINSGKATYMYSLIETSVYDEEKRQSIEAEISGGITESRADELIMQLKNDQQNPLTQIGAPSKTESKEAVKDEMEDEPN